MVDYRTENKSKEMEDEESENGDAPEELMPRRGALSAVSKFFWF